MIRPTRRSALSLLTCMAVIGLRPAMSQSSVKALEEVVEMTLGAPVPFDPVFMALQARAMAAKPCKEPSQVSQGWRDLTYDQFCGIWFGTRHTLFRSSKGAVRVEFFPAGLYFAAKIALHAVEAGEARTIVLEKRVFDTTDAFPDLPEGDTGFAGFRLLGELKAAGLFQGSGVTRCRVPAHPTPEQARQTAGSQNYVAQIPQMPGGKAEFRRAAFC